MPAAPTVRRPPASRSSRASTRRAPARRRRRQRTDRWWPALVVVLVLLTAVAWVVREGRPFAPVTAGCAVAGSSVRLTAEQATNAAAIADVARDRDLPDRAVVIALATAQQESGLRNLDYGDRDSLGLFQQRPSQGWGTPAQVQDPGYAAGAFYDRLVEVRGWESGRLTEVAQAVQRSGFPEAYQKHEPMARAITEALMTTDPWCR